MSLDGTTCAVISAVVGMILVIMCKHIMHSYKGFQKLAVTGHFMMLTMHTGLGSTPAGEAGAPQWHQALAAAAGA